MTMNREQEVGDVVAMFHVSRLSQYELRDALCRLGVWPDQAELMAVEAEAERKETRANDRQP